MSDSELWEWHGVEGDPSQIEWMGIVFPKGVAVSVRNPHMLTKLPGNPNFRKAPDDKKRTRKARIRSVEADSAERDVSNGGQHDDPDGNWAAQDST